MNFNFNTNMRRGGTRRRVERQENMRSSADFDVNYSQQVGNDDVVKLDNPKNVTQNTANQFNNNNINNNSNMKNVENYINSPNPNMQKKQVPINQVQQNNQMQNQKMQFPQQNQLNMPIKGDPAPYPLPKLTPLESMNNLEEGVVFQPVNKEMLEQMISKNQYTNEELEQGNKNKNIVKNITQEAPVNKANEEDEYFSRMESIAQDERNGRIFYENLAQKAPNYAHKEMLMLVSDNCKSRKERLYNICSLHGGRKIEENEVPINNKISFRDGVTLALEEENRSLKDLVDIYEDLENTKISKELTPIIYRKICDVNSLQLIKAKLI